MESISEIWASTEDPYYEVSNFGRVRSLPRMVACGPKTGEGLKRVPGKMLSTFPSKQTGYLHVSLSGKKRRSVHRLVAFAFCDGYFDGASVNHKNGIRSDNMADNLEWVTCQENIIHSWVVLKSRKPTRLCGVDNPGSRATVMTKIDTGESERFISGIEAIRKYNFLDSGAISKCCNGKLKSHKGYKFRFDD